MNYIDKVLKEKIIETNGFAQGNEREIKETAKKLLKVLDGVQVGIAQKALVAAKASYEKYATDSLMEMKLEIKDYNPLKGS